MRIALRLRVCGVASVVAMAATLTALGQSAAAAANESTSNEPPELARQLAALLAEPAVSRAHWGVMVTAMDGKLIDAMNESQLFQPASNAKLFTTAAALALLGPGSRFETRVEAAGSVTDGVLKGNLVLVGDGDPNISGRAVPYLLPALRPKTTGGEGDPLRAVDGLAEQIVAAGVKEIDGDIVGDDTLFPWEPYAADWVIDDMVWGYGAPVSALSVNDNQVRLTISPGTLPKITSAKQAGPATKAIVSVAPDLSFYAIDNEIETTEAKTKTLIGIDRAVGSRTLRLFGTMAADAPADVEEIAISDPAEYAAMALEARLAARGVAVKGKAIAWHKVSEDAGSFLEEAKEPVPGLGDRARVGDGAGAGLTPCLRCNVNRPPGNVLASHRSATVGEDVVVTNKASQNLHAELLLHQLSVAFSDSPDLRAGSTAQGARVVRQFLVNAGIDKDDFVFYDGSGLSGHDLVTPRAVVKLLQFASTQPWFAEYKASLPIGGIDGGLQNRFTTPALKGHVFAKTGTLGEARALSGYLECASGRTVIFSVMVGNHAPGTSADKQVMDKIVAAIAAAN